MLYLHMHELLPLETPLQNRLSLVGEPLMADGEMGRSRSHCNPSHSSASSLVAWTGKAVTSAKLQLTQLCLLMGAAWQ